MNKKRVLTFIPKLYHGGGAERSALALGEALEGSYENYFLTQHAGDTDTYKNFQIHTLGQSESSIAKIIDIVPSACRLAKFCKDHSIDIVIGHMVRANTIIILAKILCGMKTKNILITHNAKTGKKIHRLATLFYNLADQNVAVSKGSEHVLKTNGVKNTMTIFNPFNFDEMETKYAENVLPEHEKYFTAEMTYFAIGRLHEQKGLPYLIDAFAKTSSGKLLIAGEGNYRERLEKQISNLGMSDRVILLGNIKNIFPYLKKSDVFVLSSLWEGLPTVVIEAQFSNTPIIAADCLSGPREMLTNIPYGEPVNFPYLSGQNYLIQTPAVSPEEFEKNFLSVLPLMKKKVSTSVQLLEQYSESTIAAAWQKLLADVTHETIA